MGTVYRHPEVVQVAPLDGSGGRFQNIVQSAKGPADPSKPPPNRKTEFVNVTVIDAIPGYVTVPTDYSDALIETLRQPYAVAVDETALGRLGVKVGDKAIYNGKTITIAAVTKGYPNMMRADSLMVKIADPARAAIVAAQLNKASGGAFKAWTRQIAAFVQTALGKVLAGGVLTQLRSPGAGSQFSWIRSTDCRNAAVARRRSVMSRNVQTRPKFRPSLPITDADADQHAAGHLVGALPGCRG
eukprot:gene16369-21693_t